MKGIKVEEYLVMGSSDTKQCVGYDKHEQTLMVPQQDTNSVNFTVPKNLTVNLAPADPTMVTISPSTITGDGQKHRLTLNPGTKVGTTRINVLSSDGTSLGRDFQVDVKPRLPVHLRLFTITESTVGDSPSKPLTAMALQAELDRIFLRQANLKFQIDVSANASVAYDLNHDHKLQVNAVYLNGVQISSCNNTPFLPQRDTHCSLDMERLTLIEGVQQQYPRPGSSLFLPRRRIYSVASSPPGLRSCQVTNCLSGKTT